MPQAPAAPSPLRKLLNFLTYEAGRVASVWEAARGWTWLGPAVVGGLAAFHLVVMPERGREAAFMLAAGVAGFLIDTAQALAGAFSFGAHSPLPWLCPLWMAALWVVFATLFHSSLGWLRGRFRLSAMLGGLGRPLADWAGAKVGALTLSDPPGFGLALSAAAWALAMPLLLWLSLRIVPPPPALPAA